MKAIDIRFSVETYKTEFAENTLQDAGPTHRTLCNA
jgi:hypothetical protein